MVTNSFSRDLLPLYESIYSFELSASIPVHQDSRVPVEELFLDISSTLKDSSSNIDQFIESVYTPMY